MNTIEDTKEYYKRITELDIGQVARQLLAGRVMEDSPQRLQCDCPNHTSQSKRSLHVMLDRQGWYCFGCGVGGDVLQLVEFIHSGKVTAGVAGPMPQSHRQARDYLAELSGLPSLSRFGLTPERVASTEAERVFEMRVKDALTAVARLYHKRLKDSPEALKWLMDRYAISEETIDALLIGYADNGPGVVAPLCAQGFSMRELAATGAFHPTSQDGLMPFYDQRIVFPYWSRGRVVFMIGRTTPWTPKHPWEQGKYKKLPVHDERTKSHLAEFINNGTLYNEDCLLSKPSQVIITEGVTDCIALMQLGLPAISPVTVRIRTADWDRLIPKLRGIERVYICQDNEISQVGLKGALQTAQILSTQRIETRLVILPLSAKQTLARQELFDKFALPHSIEGKELSELLARRTPEEAHEIRELVSQAKIDVNEYVTSGHGREDFQGLLAQACTPLEFGVRSLPIDASQEQERNLLLEPLLAQIALQLPLEQERLVKLVHDRLGGLVSRAALKSQVKALHKAQRKAGPSAQAKERKQFTPVAPVGSCRARIEQVLFDSDQGSGAPDYTQAAEAAFEWFKANGGRFFRTHTGEPFMYFDNALYWMDSSDRSRKRQYSAMLYFQTGLIPTSGGGRTFFEILPTLAVLHGELRDNFTWIHSDVSAYTVYFNLNNQQREIVKICPDGIEVMPNGGNVDGVILEGSRKILPLTFMPDADEKEADRLLLELLVGNLTCPPGDRLLVLAWLSCFLLIDFSGTRPMTRFEGPSGSGKTTASKLISTLIYGEPQHKKSTDAANYTDGSQNPLIVLDNIEVKQMTDELVGFLLTSITGIAKEKRKGGSDIETVSERTRCLVNTTGIEPLCGELSEIQSRSFVVQFDFANQSNECFIESEAIAALQRNRNLIMSVFIKRTRIVLAMIRDGMRGHAMSLLQQALGNHDKRRCNEYLSLMYLMLLAGSSKDDTELGLKVLSQHFTQEIQSLNETSQDTSRESNSIATSLSALLHAYRNAAELDRNVRYGDDDRANHVSGFIERYQVRFEADDVLEWLTATRLLVTLRRVSREFNIEFAYRNPVQLARRIQNDALVLREAGLEITRLRNSHTKNYDYRIKFVGV